MISRFRDGIFGDAITGLAVVNEADWDAPGLYAWYNEVVAAVREVDPGVPVLVSDGWDLGRAAEWASKCNGIGGLDMQKRARIARNPVVVDTHKYWCFSKADCGKSPAQIIEEVPKKLAVMDGKTEGPADKGVTACVVGEYSCVLSEQTWKKGRKSREELVKEFGLAQSRRYHQRSAGAFFWSCFMDWKPGGEWGFIAQTRAQNIIPPASLTLPRRAVQAQLSEAGRYRTTSRTAAIDSHIQYWTRVAPGKAFEHWRFEKGWDAGWTDAERFYTIRGEGGLVVDRARGSGEKQGADVIGAVGLWCLKRVVDCGMDGSFVWEFEHGLRKGVADFGEAIGC